MNPSKRPSYLQQPRLAASDIPRLKLLKPADVASLLGLSIVTIRRRVKDGSLLHVRLNGRLYFRLPEISSYIERHATPLWSPQPE